MVYLQALFFLCYFSIACSNSESNHKNNNTPAKSVPPVISTSQMSSSKTIAENILNDTTHSILAEALDSTNLMETLTKPGPFTVFSPTNDAFKKLPTGILDGWMKKRKNDLANILSFHVVAGLIKTRDMKDGEKLKTLAGEELIVTRRKHKLLVNGIKVIEPDIQASNGIIYVIDDILFPRNQNTATY